MTKNTLRKTVAVTGATGFLGGYLIEELAHRHIVYTVFDRKKHNLLKPESLQDFVSKKDIIIHLAGKDKDSGFVEMMRTNILGIQGLLDAIAMYNPSAKLIFASSFMVYLKDDAFGATKKISEELIKRYNKKYLIKTITLRFSNIYGPRGKPFHNSVVATLVDRIKKGEKVTISGDGSQERDFLYVSDAADAIIKAMNYTPKNVEHFDICTSARTSLNQVIKILAAHEKKKTQVVYDDSIGNQPYNVQKKYSHAKEKFGWEPKVSLTEGLQRVMEAA